MSSDSEPPLLVPVPSPVPTAPQPKRKRPMASKDGPLSVPVPRGFSGAHLRVALDAGLFSHIIQAMAKVDCFLVFDFYPSSGLAMTQRTRDGVLQMSVTLQRPAFHVYDVPGPQTVIVKMEEGKMAHSIIESFKVGEYVTLYRALSSPNGTAESLHVYQQCRGSDGSALTSITLKIPTVNYDPDVAVVPSELEYAASVTLPQSALMKVVDPGNRSKTENVVFSADFGSMSGLIEAVHEDFSSVTTTVVYSEPDGVTATIKAPVGRVTYAQSLIKLSLCLRHLAGKINVSFAEGMPFRVRHELLSAGQAVGGVECFVRDKLVD